MKKICIVITNRSSWGRYKAVCEAIEKHPELELIIVTAGAGNSLDIPYKVSDRIYCLTDGDNGEAMAVTTASLTLQLVPILSRIMPDYLYIHGDRFEMLGVALVASYLGIKIAHAEGGEQSGCIDDKVRNAITELADLHFPVTQSASLELALRNKTNICRVGSPAIDLLLTYNLQSDRDYPYMVVLVHPNTTKEENVNELIDALQKVNTHIVWVNPNFDAGSKALLKKIHQLNVEFVKDLTPEDYYRLIANADILVGNTSSGIKEGSFLGVPYICVGDRQADRESDVNTIKVDYDKELILENIIENACKKFGRSTKFGDGYASIKIASVLAGDAYD